jgi:DNA (cytosine-5)-methyltransferase 1
MVKLRVLDLFSGIGGFSLGLERTGFFETAAFCEVDAKARLVLKKHWPDVPIFEDVKTLKGSDVGYVEVICGGFPCQDISLAGKGAGLAGERSGLWFQYHRLIEEIRPQYAIIENVSALRTRGLDAVLGSLAQIGYDAEWHCIPASAVGAPHRRDRIWITAFRNADNNGKPVGAVDDEAQRLPSHSDVADAGCQPAQAPVEWRLPAIQAPQRTPWWEVEPNVGRVANGVPNRMDRLKQLGNAVVPQIPEIIGRSVALDWLLS